jgi:hypothetical protein
MTTQQSPLERLEEASTTGEAPISPTEEVAADAPADEPVSPVVPGPAENQTPGTSAQWETPPATTTSAEEVSQVPLFSLPEEFRQVQTAEPQSLTSQERERLQYLEQERQQLEGVRTQQREDQELSQLRTQYENSGYDSETIESFIQIHRHERQKLHQEREQIQSYVQEYSGRIAAADHYGKQYGVNPQDLMGSDSPKEMERQAKLIQHIAQQHERLSALEQQKIPEQHYDGGIQGGGPMEGAALEEAIGNGLALTSERMIKLQEYYKSQGYGR